MMHFRDSIDPIPLKESVSMEYSNYPELPNYFGIDPPPHSGHPPAYNHQYGGYPARGMKPCEPIVPNENDILMGRGGKNNQHVGNEKLRKLARKEAKEYNTSSKKGKSNIAKGLVMKIRQMQPPGRFLKRNPVTSEWEDVGDDYAREKASQVLRDALALLSETGQLDGNTSGSESDATPELRPEPKRSKPEKSRSKRKAKSLPPYIQQYHPHYHPVDLPSTAWQYQAPLPPLALPPPPPSFKRHRSNNFFERCAFFSSNEKADSARSLLGPVTLSPCPSRRESLCASVGPVPLQGNTPPHATPSEDDRNLLDPELLPPDLKSAISDEFFSDFY